MLISQLFHGGFASTATSSLTPNAQTESGYEMLQKWTSLTNAHKQQVMGELARLLDSSMRGDQIKKVIGQMIVGFSAGR